MATLSLTMSVKALRLLWPVKDTNEDEGKGLLHTAKHKKAKRQVTGNISILIPP
jgi:hypothetical protein